MKYPVILTRGVIVFPKQVSQIEIKREQSKVAVNFSKVNHDNMLVLVSQKNVSDSDINNPEQFYEIGTLVRVDVVSESASGTTTIKAKGLERVKLSNIKFNGGKMVEADVEVLQSVETSSEENTEMIKGISEQLDTVLSSMIQIPKSALNMLATGISASELSDLIAHYMPLTISKKQSLLETTDVNSRLQKVSVMMMEENQISDIEKTIENNVRGSLDKQQKEYLLRERMKAIKEELGDISSKDSEIDKWREDLNTEKFPEEVKTATLEEIKKFEQIPPISAESNVIKGYIDWIMKLPWKTYTKDNDDIKKAQEVLDKHHFGLEKVKERIIEHLAVKINTKSSSSPILTLVGPPGVGKTSLGKSIAEAVGRKFVKVSLGGVRDEAEIRGHRRTYVGAMPGKIIQAMYKAKSSNPIILLDEIDKMSSDYRGDPTSAMLEVLDPEQNVHYQDHFLEIEYDLSKVMFIGTANYYNQIPGPLLDRIELIFLDQYTSEEKLQIAKNYIIPKALSEHGLKPEQFNISMETIEMIIDKYTAEAGVRGLQRVMNKLARKVVLKIVNKEIKDKFEITYDVAKELLGKETTNKEVLEGKEEIGVANGMYYSEVGGGILPIEVTTFPSDKGGITITGSIKDVMKESLQVAIAYIRSNAKKFGVDFDFEKNSIQVHVPAGATPKDGPSAGTAFTTALISALKKEAVAKTYALTGEITLRGKVLPIGGLKEKTIGAVEAGVRTIFIPKKNEKDVDDLADKVKKLAKIIIVDDYSEIYSHIFKG